MTNNLTTEKAIFWQNIKKTCEKAKQRKKILTEMFQQINDVEILSELQKRVHQQTIKLSIYPNQEYISIQGKHKTGLTIYYLPIEIKEKDHE